MFKKFLIFFLDLFFLTIRKSIKKEWITGNIVIVTLHRLGDSVFTIPVIKAIFNHHQNSKIFILAYNGTREIFKPHFKDEFIIEIPKELVLFKRIANSKARGILKKFKPEIIYDLNTSVIGASLIFNSKARKIVGVNKRYYKNIYDKFNLHRKTPKLMDMYLDVVQQDFDIPDRQKLMLFPYKPLFNSNKILIHPFAGWKAKEWNFLKFVELADLIEKAGYEVSFVCEKGKIPQDVLKNLNINVIETPSTSGLIDEIDKCFLFISNDSGPLYIAGSRGKATFSIYGPTNPEYSLLQGDHHSFIQNILSCSPGTGQYCITVGGFYCPVYECMNNLTVTEVLNQVILFIHNRIKS